MYKKLLICAFSLTLLTGCMKDSNNPVYPEQPVFGIEYSYDTGETQVAIPAPQDDIPEQPANKPTILEEIDKFLQGKVFLLLLFILLQWLHLMYYTATGKKSGVLTKITKSLWSSLGIVYKIIYKYIKSVHYKKNPTATRLPK